jgi:triacylglycerol lipase
MRIMARRLEKAGFAPVLVDYPSRRHPVEKLAEITAEKIRSAGLHRDGRLHFVTHSLGGILTRLMLSHDSWPGLGRVVMLAPPSLGSELADILRAAPLLWRVFGPAGRQLGTGPESVPSRLPPPNYEVGVIAGNRSFNPLYSLIIPGPDDGMVSVRRAGFPGMKDFLVTPHAHTFIMNSIQVSRQTIFFLRHGRFFKRS